MANVDANRALLRYIEEVTAGTTPSTPTMQQFRLTSEGLNANRDFTASEELRSDRQRADLVATAETNEGELGIEWSFSTHDDFIEGALQGVWSDLLTFSATTVSATASTKTISDSGSGFPTADLVVGQWIRVGGFANDGNNGVFRISAEDADDITFDAKLNLDAFTMVDEAATPTVTLKGRFVKNGTTKHFYSIEVEFPDADAGSGRFKQFLGAHPTTMSMSAETENILTGSFGFLSLSNVESGSTLASVTTATTSTAVLNAVDNLGQIREGGTLYTDGVQSLDFTLNNNARPQRQIGQFALAGVGFGTVDVTGTITAFYTGDSDSQALYDSFLNSTTSSFDLAWQDAAGNTLLVVFPAVKYGAITRVAGGINTDVVLDIEWQAFRDATSDSTIQFHSIPV